MGRNFSWPINPSTSGPVQFVQDGTVETVNLDTSNPSNSTPLPVTILNPDGTQVDASTATNQDLQIIEAQSTNTKLDTLNATDFATEAKQDVQITAANLSNTKLDTLIAKDYATFTEQANQTQLLSTIAEAVTASFFTLPFDTLQVSLKTSDGPTQIISKMGGVAGTVIQTLNISYDVDGDFESAVVS